MWSGFLWILCRNQDFFMYIRKSWLKVKLRCSSELIRIIVTVTSILLQNRSISMWLDLTSLSTVMLFSHATWFNCINVTQKYALAFMGLIIKSCGVWLASKHSLGIDLYAYNTNGFSLLCDYIHIYLFLYNSIILSLHFF